MKRRTRLLKLSSACFWQNSDSSSLFRASGRKGEEEERGAPQGARVEEEGTEEEKEEKSFEETECRGLLKEACSSISKSFMRVS